MRIKTTSCPFKLLVVFTLLKMENAADPASDTRNTSSNRTWSAVPAAWLSWAFDKCELHFRKSMLFCYLYMDKLKKTLNFYISLLLSLKQFQYSLLNMSCAPHIWQVSNYRPASPRLFPSSVLDFIFSHIRDFLLLKLFIQKRDNSVLGPDPLQILHFLQA